MIPSCLFPCISFRFELPDDTHLTYGSTTSTTTTLISKHKKKPSTPSVIDSSSGAMRLPKYKIVSRDNCLLLKLSWEQKWQQVAIRCVTTPEETFCRSENTFRTALHLITLNNAPCPIEVAQALLKANRHMVLMTDKDSYTPLHNVCFFRSSSALSRNHPSYGCSRTPTTTSDAYQDLYNHCSRTVGEIADNGLIPLFCDTSIMVEQELQGRGILPESNGVSPLYLAAKRAASLSTLQVLLRTRQQPCSSKTAQQPPRRRAQWIAPSTGGEPYWDATSVDEYSSPLETLLRHRSATVFRSILTSSCDTINDDRKNIVENNNDHQKSETDKSKRLQHILRAMAFNRLGRTQASARTTNANGNPNLFNGKYDDLRPEDCQAILLWAKCIELLAEHCSGLQAVAPTGTSGDVNDSDTVSQRVLSCGLVHVVARLKVPIPTLLQLVLKVFPEDALMRDEYGMLPLHHVLEAKHPYATKALLGILLRCEPASAHVNFPMPRFAPDSLSATVDGDVDEKYANASLACQSYGFYKDSTAECGFTSSGPSPLIRALELNLPLDLVGEMLVLATSVEYANLEIMFGSDMRAYPNALEVADPITGLYPFALAASHDYDLSIIYSFLLACPQVLLYHGVASRPSSA